MVTALAMYFETSKILRHPSIHVIVVNSNLFEAVGDTQIYSGMQMGYLLLSSHCCTTAVNVGLASIPGHPCGLGVSGLDFDLSLQSELGGAFLLL